MEGELFKVSRGYTDALHHSEKGGSCMPLLPISLLLSQPHNSGPPYLILKSTKIWCRGKPRAAHGISHFNVHVHHLDLVKMKILGGI